MIFFITVLRALAACFITNAHYEGIYPTDIIANGGLIGDVLFFAISGYCLYNIKLPFLKWYGKRIYRIYVPVLLMTTLYVVLGQYSLTENNAVWWFVYPTYYHFVASIVVLYIPFYICVSINILKRNLPNIMLAIAGVYILIYLTVYDKSYYHIDTVREPMIRFLFMESMLLGACFKQNDEKFRNSFKLWYPLATFMAFILYFVTKLFFSNKPYLSGYQIFNQVAIFILLFFIFLTFAGLDYKLEKMPSFLKKAIQFLSSITLEIYLVQYVLIRVMRPIGRFPLNWIVITSSILLTAFILHKSCDLVYKEIEVVKKKIISKGD